MKSIFSLLIFILTLANAQDLYVASDYNVALEKAKKEQKNITMFIYTEYCPWCERMKKNTFTDKNVIEFLNKNTIFLMVDKDLGNFPSEFNPRVVPTTLLIDYQTQSKLAGMFGYKSATEFIEGLK